MSTGRGVFCGDREGGCVAVVASDVWRALGSVEEVGLWVRDVG